MKHSIGWVVTVLPGLAVALWGRADGDLSHDLSARLRPGAFFSVSPLSKLHLSGSTHRDHQQPGNRYETDDPKLAGRKWTNKGNGPFAIKTHKAGMQAECGVTYKAKSSSEKDDKCPKECPYYTQNRADDRFCTFVCVKAKECAEYNPMRPIGDDKLGNCRSPMVQACREYVLDIDDGIDHCAVCNGGYHLGSDGQCHYKMMDVIEGVAVVALIIILILAVWLIEMGCRTANNQTALDEALDFKNRQLLQEHVAVGHHGEGSVVHQDGPQLWPLSTNLCTTDVAGAGMMLHFNYQVAVMVWALFIAGVWAILAGAIDPALFVLGTRKFGTPRANCILVAWGYETQRDLMWVKILFLWIAYISSTVMALVLGIRQLRLYQTLDFQQKTMKDFVAMAENLPMLPSSRRLEEDVKQSVADFMRDRGRATSVVGVSVAWIYKDEEDEVMRALKMELKRQEAALCPPLELDDEDAAPEERTALKAWIYNKELSLFGPDTEEEDLETKVTEFFTYMVSSENAFIVFATQEARDSAIEAAADMGGIPFEGNMVKLTVPTCEPATVQWQNFGPSGSKLNQSRRMIQGWGCIFLALLFWTTVFYLPYAWSIFQFNYDNGQEPGFAYSMTFTLVVAVGNAIMYEVCNRVAEHVGFKFKDEKEGSYLIFYTIACTFNIAVDFITTYVVAFVIMSELGFRTYDGTLLKNVPMFPQGFETYAMQRTMAENTKAYAFPSTFLIPFLIEPFPTVFLPLWFGKLIVRTHKEIQGVDAEEWVTAAPMEMGRYGDLLLNIVLGIMIFFFPGGYTIFLFLAMAGSHLFIYAFDHWRVLRAIPNCMFASLDIDWWAQAMLAPCCGLIASCLVFKSQNQRGLDWAKSEFLGVWGNAAFCSAAFAGHVVVHMLMLVYVVPLFGLKAPEEDALKDVTYEDVSRELPANWFTTNPVHCLRSQRFYKHSPPVGYYVGGKEFLMSYNPELGCYYQKELKTPATTPREASKDTPRGSFFGSPKSPKSPKKDVEA